MNDAVGRISGRGETRTFGTMTRDVLALSDWLTEHRVTHVALESTGVYCKPIVRHEALFGREEMKKPLLGPSQRASKAEMYEADWGNNRVQMFNQEGHYIWKFLGHATLSRVARTYMMTNAMPNRLRGDRQAGGGNPAQVAPVGARRQRVQALRGRLRVLPHPGLPEGRHSLDEDTLAVATPVIPRWRLSSFQKGFWIPGRPSPDASPLRLAQHDIFSKGG